MLPIKSDLHLVGHGHWLLADAAERGFYAEPPLCSWMLSRLKGQRCAGEAGCQ